VEHAFHEASSLLALDLCGAELVKKSERVVEVVSAVGGWSKGVGEWNVTEGDKDGDKDLGENEEEEKNGESKKDRGKSSGVEGSRESSVSSSAGSGAEGREGSRKGAGKGTEKGEKAKPQDKRPYEVNVRSEVEVTCLGRGIKAQDGIGFDLSTWLARVVR
jgi:hypothetical protein